MIDKLYYIIYNSYNKRGEKNEVEPPSAVFGLFMVAIFCIGLTLIGACYLLNDPNHFIKRKSIDGKTLWLIGSGLITYVSFYHNKRYKDIYNVYRGLAQYDIPRYRFIAFVIIYLLIASPILCALIYNKIYLGGWV